MHSSDYYSHFQCYLHISVDITPDLHVVKLRKLQRFFNGTLYLNHGDRMLLFYQLWLGRSPKLLYFWVDCTEDWNFNLNECNFCNWIFLNTPPTSSRNFISHNKPILFQDIIIIVYYYIIYTCSLLLSTLLIYIIYYL